MDSTETEFSLEARKALPRRRERSDPCARREIHDQTDEGQSRRIVWEVCPVKRPLLTVAKITKAGNQVYLDEDKAFVKNNKTGQITNLRRERNVWMLDFRVRRPADAIRGWAAEYLRQHNCDDDGTGSCKTIGTS